MAKMTPEFIASRADLLPPVEREKFLADCAAADVLFETIRPTLEQVKAMRIAAWDDFFRITGTTRTRDMPKIPRKLGRPRKVSIVEGKGVWSNRITRVRPDYPTLLGAIRQNDINNFSPTVIVNKKKIRRETFAPHLISRATARNFLKEAKQRKDIIKSPNKISGTAYFFYTVASLVPQ